MSDARDRAIRAFEECLDMASGPSHRVKAIDALRAFWLEDLEAHGGHALIDDYQERAEKAEARVRELEAERDTWRHRAEGDLEALKLAGWAAQDHTPPTGMPTAGTAATEGDWAERLADAWWNGELQCGRPSPKNLAAEFRAAERRGEVKGLRWAANAMGRPETDPWTLRNRADELEGYERQGKGGK